MSTGSASGLGPAYSSLGVLVLAGCRPSSEEIFIYGGEMARQTTLHVLA